MVKQQINRTKLRFSAVPSAFHSLVDQMVISQTVPGKKKNHLFKKKRSVSKNCKTAKPFIFKIHLLLLIN